MCLIQGLNSNLNKFFIMLQVKKKSTVEPPRLKLPNKMKNSILQQGVWFN